jgi:DmsA/YnfE family anaerobic dimethyl sulfoxide reductase A subunit
MKKKITSNPAKVKGIPRRDVLKWSAALGGLAALPVGLSLPFGFRRAEATSPYGRNEQIFYSGCVVNCGSQCVLRVFTKNGTIIRIESDDSVDGPQNRAIRACLRGRSMRRYTYSPDRIKYPMRRVPGTKRGEGKFERISWDEAYQTIADEWVRILDKYGPESIYRKYGSGTTSSGITRRNEFEKLANLLGGMLNEYGTYSTAQIAAAMPYIYGTSEGNTINDMEHSKLVVMFGLNILETRQSGGGLCYELFEAGKKGNARRIIVDPRYSDSVAKLADEWVPIRPGSDGALVAGIAYVLITEGLVDTEFLDKYCVGFDEEHMPEGIPPGNSYKSYILGEGSDGTPKTPEWAADITGYPADRIIRLAREIGSAKPCCVIQGWGPQRHANGDTLARSIAMLAIMTGNVGISGGGSGNAESLSQIRFPRMPSGKNPIKTTISFFTWEKAITDPKSVTAKAAGLRGKDSLEHGIKFLWNSSGNSLINQHSDINSAKKTLQDESKCEFIVVVENRLTSSAMYADILLPSVTPPEQDDIIQQGYQVDQSSILVARKAVEPLFESKSQYDICRELSAYIGKRIGRPDLQQLYSEGRSQLDWAKWLYAESRKLKPDMPESFEEASKIGIFKWFPMPQKIAYKAFRDDPENKPLKTPTGKIEIFSRRLWDMNNSWELPEGEAIHAVPVYESTSEGPDDHKGKEKYPFQLIGHHYKGRTHSSYGNLPWLMQVAPQQLWMNTLDAERRGIKHGDTVKVFNDRGVVQVQVKVTPRIMPGVLSLPQGAWYKPDKNGVDVGACINTLTKMHPTPLAKGNPQHTNLVDVVKIQAIPL